MATKSVPVGQLLLDLENPRYGEVHSQAEAMKAIIEHQGQKLVNLAEHIGMNGMNPADLPLVMAKGKNFIVPEGNRRLAAVRLLERPVLAAGTTWHAAFHKLADEHEAPQTIDCSLMVDRDEARPWILLRHAGESRGVGPVPWGVAERERFEPRPGTQAFQGLAFIDAAKGAYPDDADLHANLDKIREERPSTLGRVLNNADFKKRIGTVTNDGQFIARFSAAALQQLARKIAEDFAHHVSVSAVKLKEQQKAYIDDLPVPKDTEALPGPAPLDSAPVKSSSGKSGGKRKPKPRPKQNQVLRDLDLENLSARTRDVVAEVRTIDIERLPNTASIMVRAVLELAVDDYLHQKGINKAKEFKDRVRRALKDVDPTEKDKAWQPIRTGLQDASSLHSVSTLHAFVHHGSFHPTAGDVRSIAANWGPFVQALNDLL
jgi:hypothetical protein